MLSFYGLRYKGVFSTSLEAEAAHLVNSNGVPFEAGDAWYEDLSGPEGSPDGVIDDYDKTIIGSAIPEYFGGISTSISYGRWSIQAGFQYVYGNEAFNYVRSLNEGMSGLSNQSVRVMNRWVREGQITDVPRASWNDPAGNAVFSTRWIEDASYLRLKDVTLAYTIKEKFLVFRNAEVYLTGINLLTYSKYLGYDPEFSYSYQTMLQGIDYGLMPQGKKLMLGIKLGF